MLGSQDGQLERRLQSLEKHLERENPVLLKAVQSFRELDWIAHRMGLLDTTESYATRVPWWPLISVLGTFSAGKSSFINTFLDQKIQRSGNQAVDDKFTVICFSKEESSHTLPGMALDADPRFPFYQISKDIDSVAVGEGKRIDSYLQLKTTPSEILRNKIIIDSPGFDADDQRTATLRITDHIMNLSDLILVFFDARHPEPGAMKDTLEHLVAKTIHRADASKFLFILNQIDCTVQDDNLEEVVAAWQRALAQAGLTAGRFYQIYNPNAAQPINDDTLRERYEAKRAEDMEAVMERVDRVEVERAYRIISVLEHTAKGIESDVVPKVTDLLATWRQRVLATDIVMVGALLITGLVMFFNSSMTLDVALEHLFMSFDGSNASTAAFGLAWWIHVFAIGVGVVAVGYLHFLNRRFHAWIIGSGIEEDEEHPELPDLIRRSFKRSTRPIRSLFAKKPAGWGGSARKRLAAVLKDTDVFVQNLNDRFTNPSGLKGVDNPAIHPAIEESDNSSTGNSSS
ncbi:MAG: dynamin family protein [Magnetococcales bacterium]|nr:dynamin family protein [Magnetococcales bacterium]